MLAVAHEKLADDSTGQVLHLLDAGVDDDGSRRNHRAGQFRGRRPAADADRQQQGDDRAADEMAADRAAFVAKDHVFHGSRQS